MTRDELLTTDQLVIPIADAGEAAFGLKKTASYDAAARGELPCVTVNGRRYVAVWRLRAMLGIPPEGIRPTPEPESATPTVDE